MSDDELRSMMRERESAFSAALGAGGIDEVGGQRVLKGAATQRRRSGWVRAAAAAAAVVVLGVGTWALLGWRGQAEPVGTPVPSAPPSATPSDPPEPSGIVWAAPLPADGFFLDAQQMDDTVWQEVGDGWTLTYWEPSRQLYGDAGHEVTDPNKAAVYLMSPDGKRYELGHFDSPGDAIIQTIVRWDPYTLEAIVQVYEDDVETWQWLDVRDGTREAVEGIPRWASLVGWTADHAILFQSGSELIAFGRDASTTTILKEDAGLALLSPDGTTVVVPTVDYESGPNPVTAYSSRTGEALWTYDLADLDGDAPAACRVDGWASPDKPAVICQTTGGTDADPTVGPATFLALDETGPQEIQRTDDSLDWWNVQLAADGVVAIGADPGAQGYGPVYYLDKTPLTQWPAPSGHQYIPSLHTVGSVEIARWGSGADYGSTSARDVATGAAFDVTPPLQADPEWWWTTTTATFLVGGLGAFS